MGLLPFDSHLLRLCSIKKLENDDLARWFIAFFGFSVEVNSVGDG